MGVHRFHHLAGGTAALSSALPSLNYCRRCYAVSTSAQYEADRTVSVSAIVAADSGQVAPYRRLHSLVFQDEA